MDDENPAVSEFAPLPHDLQLHRLLYPSSLIGAGMRTVGFAGESIRRGLSMRRSYPEVPVPRPTLTRLTMVFMEELMVLALATTDPRARHEEELARIRRETDEAIALYAEHGWDRNRAGYHQTPTAPTHDTMEARRFAGIRYQEMSFESGYEPHPGMPGRDRWLSVEPNRRCYAHVLEHPGEPRPWLVALHGFGMGLPVDLMVLRAQQFHRDLGFNVLAPVLPLHGRRRTGGRISGMGMVSLDWVANVHGVTQAVWDVRQCLAWIRERGAPSIALHGISLGGYTAALVAGLEDDLSCVIAGVPAATIHRPLSAAFRGDPEMRRVLDEHGLLDDRVEEVHAVVTPTELRCRLPIEDRYIYAGTADRLATPNEPYLLWEHWERPDISWTQRSHMLTMLSGQVNDFVRDAVVSSAVRRSGLPDPEIFDL